VGRRGRGRPPGCGAVENMALLPPSLPPSQPPHLSPPIRPLCLLHEAPLPSSQPSPGIPRPRVRPLTQPRPPATPEAGPCGSGRAPGVWTAGRAAGSGPEAVGTAWSKEGVYSGSHSGRGRSGKTRALGMSALIMKWDPTAAHTHSGHTSSSSPIVLFPLLCTCLIEASFFGRSAGVAMKSAVEGSTSRKALDMARSTRGEEETTITPAHGGCGRGFWLGSHVDACMRT
jgi:hypothetical protein